MAFNRSDSLFGRTSPPFSKRSATTLGNSLSNSAAESVLTSRRISVTFDFATAVGTQLHCHCDLEASRKALGAQIIPLRFTQPPLEKAIDLRIGFVGGIMG